LEISAINSAPQSLMLLGLATISGVRGVFSLTPSDLRTGVVSAYISKVRRKSPRTPRFVGEADFTWSSEAEFLAEFSGDAEIISPPKLSGTSHPANLLGERRAGGRKHTGAIIQKQNRRVVVAMNKLEKAIAFDQFAEQINPISEAMAWLLKYLTEHSGCLEDETLFAVGLNLGHERSALFEAKRRLNIRAYKARAGWVWMLEHVYLRTHPWIKQRVR